MFFYIFIQQGRIKLIKSDSKDIYNITKDYISEILQNWISSQFPHRHEHW